MRSDPVNSCYDARVTAGPTAIEDADSIEIDIFRDAVSGTTDRAGHVSSVTVAIGRGPACCDLVDSRMGTSAKINVTEVDSGVDDIDGHSCAICVVRVGAVHRQRALVDSVDTPSSA